MRHLLIRLNVLLPLLVLAPAAWAHPGHGLHVHTAFGAFSAGFVHPFSGLDHILAMVAVGLWAAQMGGRALWAVPLSFVVTMAVGGALGVAGVPLPGVELGIAGSVLVFGLLITVGARLPLAMGMALTALFALFHGYAHGAELVAGASALAYGAGFVVATAALHGLGLGAGVTARGQLPGRAIRIGGGAIAGAGAYLLALLALA